MEPERRKKNNKRIRENDDSDSVSSSSSSPLTANLHTLYTEILASLLNLQSSFAQSLLKQHLRKLLHFLSLKHKTLIINNNNNLFLSLLPFLLIKTTDFPSLTRLSAEIIGAFSLSSFDANERIASDDEILNALINTLRNQSKKVRVAAINAILDISTTSIGRKRLCELFAVEKLIAVFLQDATSPAKSISLFFRGKGSCRVDNFPVLVLEAVVTLINDCNLKQLKEIPKELSFTFLRYLKEGWTHIRDEALAKNVAECSKKRYYTLNNVRKHHLAESIFRLSIHHGHRTITCSPEVVKRNIFGPNHSEFEHFMLNYWEISPFLFRRLSKPPNDNEDSFSLYSKSFNHKRKLDHTLSSLLEGVVSCPPFPSDDLDILSFLKEAKDGFGCPIIYEQDIRILKTVEASKQHKKNEVHFIKDRTDSRSINDPNAIDFVNVQKCKEAFLKGYTLALRGMEFRSESVASIADGLAVLFGQPSVGANAYLTPARSQGLARHYDDHCVFVCQLLGKKKWTVLPKATVLLPRLYEPLQNLQSSEDGTSASECQQFVLGEGDILYIPRGCPHEAYTTKGDGGLEMDDASTGFSLHLTLGIEVEPPFEWEGFAHVALYSWYQNQKEKPEILTDPLYGILNIMSVNLLHISIQLIGYLDPVFRKACLVNSFSPPLEEKTKRSESLDLSQRNTFTYIMNCINKEASFLETMKLVEDAILEKNEDLFQRMRWLRHLYNEIETEKLFDWNNPLEGFENILQLYNGKKEKTDVEASFMTIKLNFCQEIHFQNVCQNFEELLQKYKNTRKQYMNGMLSLHCS